MKWFWIIVLLVIGAIATYVAVEYLTVSIHAVPSFLGPHKGRGHYRKRGSAAALVALIAFVGAGYLIFRNWKAGKVAAAAAAPAAPAAPAVTAPATETPAVAAPAPAQPLPAETTAATEQPTGE
jgi:uncharacterized membrane protein YebE (DUF533 family)